jgi:uncharacterized protein YegP (UPF0339 family)
MRDEGRVAATAAAATEGGATMAGQFEVYKDARGEFRWRLKASNGQIIATSGEGYTTKANCLGGIASVKTNAHEAETVEASS